MYKRQEAGDEAAKACVGGLLYTAEDISQQQTVQKARYKALDKSQYRVNSEKDDSHGAHSAHTNAL